MKSIHIIILFSALVGLALCQKKEPKLRVQPELDGVDVAKYLQNERLVRLQFKCLIFDGPCDIVGKWAKPRVKGILLRRCDYCTKTQEKWIEDWYDILIDRFPEMYKAAVLKYITNEHVELTEAQKKMIEDAFHHEAVGNYLKNIGDVVSNKNATTTTTTPSPMSDNSTTTTATSPDSTTSTTTAAPAETTTLKDEEAPK